MLIKLGDGKMRQMDEGVVETTEKPKSPEVEIDEILKLASDYLYKKIANGRKPDEDLDYQMRLVGAKVQGRLTEFALKRMGERHRERLRTHLNGFWRRYYELVESSCVRILKEKGFKEENLPKRVVREKVLVFRQGVIGVIATAVMAKKNGWEVRIPSTEEDVKEGIDLFIERKDRSLPLQVKCEKDAKFVITRRRDRMWVVIPARTSFFEDHQLGIPEHRHIKRFGRWIENNLEKGE